MQIVFSHLCLTRYPILFRKPDWIYNIFCFQVCKLQKSAVGSNQMTVQILILSQRTNTSKNKTAGTKKNLIKTSAPFQLCTHYILLISLLVAYHLSCAFFTFIFFKLFFLLMNVSLTCKKINFAVAVEKTLS